MFCRKHCLPFPKGIIGVGIKGWAMNTVNYLTKLAGAAAIAALAASSVAHAATFALTYTGSVYSITATLDASSLGGGDYLVTSLTGTVTDGGGPEAMTLIPGGPGYFGVPGFIVDNVLYYPANPQYVDIYGLAFTASGATWNLWGNGAGSNYSLYSYDPNSGYAPDAGSVTVSGVPEPSTWVMMGLGFAGLAFAGFRARRTATAIA